MRIGSKTTAQIDQTVKRALASPCKIVMPAPEHGAARRIYAGVSSHIEALGGNPVPSKFRWDLPNGSIIQIVF